MCSLGLSLSCAGWSSRAEWSRRAADGEIQFLSPVWLIDTARDAATDVTKAE